MTSAHIYRKNVPITIDGADFGFKCTLVRDATCHDVPDWYGIVTFTKEQADFIAETVNAHNDETDPMDDYLQGRIVYDQETDTFTEYSDNDGDDVYDEQAGFTVDGVRLYCVGADWCWSLDEEA